MWTKTTAAVLVAVVALIVLCCRVAGANDEVHEGKVLSVSTSSRPWTT